MFELAATGHEDEGHSAEDHGFGLRGSAFGLSGFLVVENDGQRLLHEKKSVRNGVRHGLLPASDSETSACIDSSGQSGTREGLAPWLAIPVDSTRSAEGRDRAINAAPRIKQGFGRARVRGLTLKPAQCLRSSKSTR